MATDMLSRDQRFFLMPDKQIQRVYCVIPLTKGEMIDRTK